MPERPSSTREELPQSGTWLTYFRIVGVGFVLYPAIRILAVRPDPLDAVAALAAAATFGSVVLFLGRRPPLHPVRASALALTAILLLIAIASVLVLRDANGGWVLLFYYGSTAASLILPERRALALMSLAGIAAAGCLLIDGADMVDAVIQGLSVAVIGVTVFATIALRRTNAQLQSARQELATLAVTEERNRIARDLHDVLGHSLSLIAIKSELAGRLLDADAPAARSEIRDIERVARESLTAVRDTVSGYRQPSLDVELANARAALAAAGIRSSIRHAAGAQPPAADAILAWAVREATTNVVRHSRATATTIFTAQRNGIIELVVEDDGSGAPAPTSHGSGLRGLAERVEAIGGSLDAGAIPAGGYRLQVTLPLTGGRE